MVSKLDSPHSLLKADKKILLVGGGTGGHTYPLYPLAERLLQDGHPVHLLVNDAPLDRQIIQDKFMTLTSLPQGETTGRLNIHYLKTHKIDYHLSLRNLVAPFKIMASFFRTKKLLKKIKPDVVFFKGGFVGFPVLVALKYLMRFRGKIYLHDSDISAGKLTQLIGKNADHVFSNFGENTTPLFYWPSDPDPGIKEKPAHNKSRDQKPRILIFGGSQGAQFLNNLIVQNLEVLTQKYHVTLVTGPKNPLSTRHSSLKTPPFLPQDELIQAIIKADLVICRSGASMFQVLAAKTPCIAIPLPTAARNHQLHNAQYFADKGLCYRLEQNAQTKDKLLPLIEQILQDKKLKQKLRAYHGEPQIDTIVKRLNTS